MEKKTIFLDEKMKPEVRLNVKAKGNRKQRKWKHLISRQTKRYSQGQTVLLTGLDLDVSLVICYLQSEGP